MSSGEEGSHRGWEALQFSLPFQEAGQPGAGCSPRFTPRRGGAGMWKLARKNCTPSPSNTPRTPPSSGRGCGVWVTWERRPTHHDDVKGLLRRTAVGVGRSAAPTGAGEEGADPIKPRSRSRLLGLGREPPPASGPHGTDAELSSLSSQRGVYKK
ncbi:hypothetical protein P7K49_005226 [Saguinus oedipus]|uniref:Uncharacterized protein n=1 Tax=Saguinus oedipus TaxID=9490 RepID=A0ABQ9W9N0_SAGOE|nr:hypothetical protein P7K49_005226 [Saguinus oedipus]